MRSLHGLLIVSIVFGGFVSYAIADEISPRTPAPEFASKIWFNSPPLQLKELLGKVVLIDFWEYTCINCIRTFPYLRRWNQLYRPAGLIIIGVHTPEFAFARNPANVADAVKRFGFTFPVAVDNEYAIWNAFNNVAWPADYLIDKDGRLAYAHIGEGAYGDFELAIRKLLKEANPGLDFAAARYAIPDDANDEMDSPVCRRATPETYLGFARGRNIANANGEDRTLAKNYSAPTTLPVDSFALRGEWHAHDEFVNHTRHTAALDDAVELHYEAKAVYLVAGSDDSAPKSLYVVQDGKPVAQNARGTDLKTDPGGRAYIQLGGKRMYYLVDNPEFGEHTVALYAIEPGVSLYSFTFGNNCENKFAHR
jgi:thiol-disulfide isomerase/thioredoxin